MVRLVLAPERHGDPAHFLSINAAGEVVDHGVIPHGAPAAKSPGTKTEERTVFVAPGAAVLARWLDIPARTEAQARAAAALMLEEEIVGQRDRTHIALGARGEGDERLVVAVDSDRMREWLTLAAAYGVTPDAITPDCLLLPEPSQPDAVLAVRFGGLLAVRGHRLAFSCEPELAATLLEGRNWKVFEDEWEAERLVVRGGADLAVDLLQGPFAPKGTSTHADRPWALAAALVIGAGILGLAAPIVTGLRAELAARRAESAIAKLTAGIGPGAKSGARGSLRAVQERVGALRAELAGGYGRLAGSLFEVLEGASSVSLESLSLESAAPGAPPESVTLLRVRLRHASAQDLTDLQQQLTSRGIEAIPGETGRLDTAGTVILTTALDLRAAR